MDADDMEKLREMEMTREENLQVVMANLTDIQSLRSAFEGCRGVFHTSAFTDPAGLSGYTVILSPSLFHSYSLVCLIIPITTLGYFLAEVATPEPAPPIMPTAHATQEKAILLIINCSFFQKKQNEKALLAKLSL